MILYGTSRLAGLAVVSASGLAGVTSPSGWSAAPTADAAASDQDTFDLDPLHVVIDVSGLGISGYDAADWLREHQRVDMGLSDHRRIEATLSLADDDQTAGRLMSALSALTEQVSDLPRASQVELPSAAGLELEPAMGGRQSTGLTAPHGDRVFPAAAGWTGSPSGYPIPPASAMPGG